MTKTYLIPEYARNKIDFIPNPLTSNRFKLEMEFDSHKIDKKLVVILKNPSASFQNIDLQNIDYTKPCLDTTTLKVVNFAHKKGYLGIITLNLFPCFDKESSVVNDRYNLKEGANPKDNPIVENLIEFEENLKIIKETLSGIDNEKYDLVCAWGDKSEIVKSYYDSQILEVISCIKSFGLELKQVAKDVNDKKVILDDTPFYPLHAQVWGYEYVVC